MARVPFSTLKPVAVVLILVIALALLTDLRPNTASVAAINPATSPSTRPGEGDYLQRVQPLFTEYCYDCHGDGSHKGDLALDKHKDNFSDLLADQKTWDLVRRQLVSHVMPPAKKEQPTAEERARILQWIDDTVFYCDPSRPDPGHVVLRRLNRNEYNNTIRDLFQTDLRPADQFPMDDTGYGFDNIGDVLTASPMLLDKYLHAAQQVAKEAFALTPPPRFRIDTGTEKLVVLHGQIEDIPTMPPGLPVVTRGEDEIGMTVENTVAAEYRLLFRIAATRVGEEPTRAQILMDGKVIREMEVAQAWDIPPTTQPMTRPTTRSAKDNTRRVRGQWKPVTFTVPAAAGNHTFSIKLANPYKDPNSTDPVKSARRIAVDGIGFDGPICPLPMERSAFLKSILPDTPLGRPLLVIGGEIFLQASGTSNNDTGAFFFTSNGHRNYTVNIHEAGKYLFRAKTGAQQAGNEPAKGQFRLDDRVLSEFSVTTLAQAPQWVEFEADLPAGEHDLQIWMTNFFKDPKSDAERRLWLHEVSIEGPLDKPSGPAARDLPQLLSVIGQKVYRRPLSDEQHGKLVALANDAIGAGETPLAALQTCVQAMLITPSFLFRDERPAGPAENGSVAVDEYTLASRLSYFLWAAPPDDKLMALAEKNELRKNLAEQVKRMLADPRSRALTDNFAGQWLQLRDVANMTPDAKTFPQFSPQLAADMRRESEMLFDHILHDNRPVLELLTADYSFINERLASLYGIKGVTGEEFRRVSLEGTPRRGILTQASILTLTSHPTRTSPVKRGKFVLEKILGEETPPQPQNIPAFKEVEPDLTTLPLRKRFEAHRANASCASCHAFLDPMGFALENYDAIGQFRTRDGAEAVDASGKLVSGESFHDMMDLNKILTTAKKDEFVKNLAENLLTFALGRGLEYTDKLAVRDICDQAGRSDDQFQDMILAICQSVPFQRMREADAKAATGGRQE